MSRVVRFSMPWTVWNGNGVKGKQWCALINGEHVYAPHVAGEYTQLVARIKAGRKGRAIALAARKREVRS